MINSRLTWYMETENILSSKQSEFRKFHSTTQQIINVSQDVRDAMDNRKSSLALFVDFKGTYNGIWKAKLLDKLRRSGISGRMLH